MYEIQYLINNAWGIRMGERVNASPGYLETLQTNPSNTIQLTWNILCANLGSEYLRCTSHYM